MPRDSNAVQALSSLRQEVAGNDAVNAAQAPLLAALGSITGVAEDATEQDRIAGGKNAAAMIISALEAYTNGNLQDIPPKFADLAPKVQKALYSLSVNAPELSGDPLAHHTADKQRNFMQALANVHKTLGLGHPPEPLSFSRFA